MKSPKVDNQHKSNQLMTELSNSTTTTTTTSRRQAPVTILTGFLGAGKTTLVNHILRTAPNKKIAVINNEFGQEIGIESLIVDAASGQVFEEIFELGNGCICCSLRGQLQQVLENILQRREAFDHIVVETTGLVNPGPVAAQFWADDDLESKYYLDAIVTVVDARNLLRHLDDKARPENAVNEAERQIDRIILNKIDLVDEKTIGELEQRVASINALATVIRATHCEVPVESVVGIGAFSTQRAMQLMEQSESNRKHASDVRTVSFVDERPVSLDLFRRWLGSLLWPSDDDDAVDATATTISTTTNSNRRDIGGSEELFRAKAVVYVADDPKHRYIMQAVHELFEVSPSSEWPVDEKPLTRIVFIGRKLDRKALMASFEERCFKTNEPK